MLIETMFYYKQYQKFMSKFFSIFNFFYKRISMETVFRKVKIKCDKSMTFILFLVKILFKTQII